MPLTINGEVIPDELIEEEMHRIKTHYEHLGSQSCCEREDEFRLYAKDNILTRVLISQEAARRNPDITEAELTAATEKMLAEFGGAEAFASEMGIHEHADEIIRAEALAGLRVDRLLTSESTAPPTEEEVLAWYHAHPDEFLTVEEAHVIHLFKTSRRVEDRDTIYKHLRSLRHQALGGADFHQLAHQHTDKEDKLIDLGWFPRGEFMEEFDTIVFSLRVDEISPVFQSQWGYHLVKLMGFRPRVTKPYAEVQPEALQKCEAERHRISTQSLVEKLKSAATITY